MGTVDVSVGPLWPGGERSNQVFVTEPPGS